MLRPHLTWWNNYLSSARSDVAYAMPWEEFKALLLKNYCPRNEVKMLEMEFWCHKVKGTDMLTYTHRYHELALMCPEMVRTQALRIERYTDGCQQLPEMMCCLQGLLAYMIP